MCEKIHAQTKRTFREEEHLVKLEIKKITRIYILVENITFHYANPSNSTIIFKYYRIYYRIIYK